MGEFFNHFLFRILHFLKRDCFCQGCNIVPVIKEFGFWCLWLFWYSKAIVCEIFSFFIYNSIEKYNWMKTIEGLIVGQMIKFSINKMDPLVFLLYVVSFFNYGLVRAVFFNSNYAKNFIFCIHFVQIYS